jgi:hypothetical protein
LWTALSSPFTLIAPVPISVTSFEGKSGVIEDMGKRSHAGRKKMPSYKYSRKTMAFPSHEIELAHT